MQRKAGFSSELAREHEDGHQVVERKPPINRNENGLIGTPRPLWNSQLPTLLSRLFGLFSHANDARSSSEFRAKKEAIQRRYVFP
jgi:hypothetical protein